MDYQEKDGGEEDQRTNLSCNEDNPEEGATVISGIQSNWDHAPAKPRQKTPGLPHRGAETDSRAGLPRSLSGSPTLETPYQKASRDKHTTEQDPGPPPREGLCKTQPQETEEAQEMPI